MWPHGKERIVLHPTQNLRSHNQSGNQENQYDMMYATYAPFIPNPPYLQHEPIGYMTYAPYPKYSQHEIGYTTYAPYPLYSQQEIGVRLSQDPTTNNVLSRDQTWLSKNNTRRNIMPQYRNGEVVMVRCNQQKWLMGVIHRMSAQGVRIWINDAKMLVNVPLVLLPTHVVKLSTYSKSQTLPEANPLWTVFNDKGYQKVLVECVRPAHLSHRQLFHVLNNVCTLCKMAISNTIDAINPWDCGHQVHNYCFQLQIEHCVTPTCPCKESIPRQVLHSASTSNATTDSIINQQQWFNIQCVCGLSIAMADLKNLNTPLVCPNCQQAINVNPQIFSIQNNQSPTKMNLNIENHKIQSKQLSAHMNLLQVYSEPIKEIIQNHDTSQTFERERFFSAQDSEIGWPIQSFSNSNRLEAIEEGSEPISPIEATTKNESHNKGSLLPTNLHTITQSVQNNVHDHDFNNNNLQPFPALSNVQHDGLILDPYLDVQHDKIKHISFQSLLQDGIIDGPAPLLVKSEQSNNKTSNLTQFMIGQKVSETFSSTKLSKMEKRNELNELENESTRKLKTTKTYPPTIEEQNKLRTPSSTIMTFKEPNSLRNVGESKTSIVIERKKLSKIMNEPDTTKFVLNRQLTMNSSIDPNSTISATKDANISNQESEPSPSTRREELLERTNEPNASLDKSGNQILCKQVNESIASFECVEGQIPLKRDSESSLNSNALEDQMLRKERHVLNTNNGQKLWRRASEVYWTNNVEKDEEIEVGSTSSNGVTKEEDIEASTSTDSNPRRTNVAPMYINHFANFVNLAMAGSSAAKDIIASASSSTSDPLPLESATTEWISPPPAFFRQASSTFTESPRWVNLSKNLDEATASPAWITVIKDGVDSRKDDKRWDSDKPAKDKDFD